MKELNRFRQYLTEGVIKENISSHKEEAKRFLEKFVDDNKDKFEFIPDLETGYIDANDNSYNVDELASIFLDIGQDIPRGTHNQKYKGEGGTYVVVSEGVIKEEQISPDPLYDMGYSAGEKAVMALSTELFNQPYFDQYADGFIKGFQDNVRASQDYAANSVAESVVKEAYEGDNLSKILKLSSDLQNVKDNLSYLIKNDPDFGWQKFLDTTNAMLRAVDNLK